MTNKQAQVTINAIKFMLDNAQYSEDVEEALNMAINALTAQPETHDKRAEMHACDLIDRQQAIDALDGEIEITGRTNAEAVKGYVRLVKDRLKRLPSAQPSSSCVHENDTISRQAAIDAHCEICGDRGRCNSDICPDMEAFQLLPSAQPEIIPCTECKYYDVDTEQCNNDKGLRFIDFGNPERMWCTWAERREG